MAITNVSSSPVAVGLCASRHPMPVSRYIFPETVDPMAFDTMETIATLFILREVGITTTSRLALDQQGYAEDVPCFTGKRPLVVYVTGLAAATAAVIKVCALNGVDLTLMHYNRETGEYVPQEIF